jgi:hypothetical protein
MMKMPNTSNSSYSEQRLAGLKVHTAAQKQATVDRLREAIEELKADKKAITTRNIYEVSGLDYTSYARNPEALALFQANSTHLTKKRKQQRKKSETPLPPRDPLMSYKKPQLVDRVRKAERWIEELEIRNNQLVQQQVESDLRDAKMQAEVAEYRTFLQKFRADIQHKEHHEDSS